MSVRRKTSLRAALGHLGGLVLGLALGTLEGCRPDDGAAFIEEAAQLMCEFNERCPGAFQQPGIDEQADFPTGDACVDGVIQVYEPCTECEFDEVLASRCLRRMQRGLDRCSFENVSMLACDAVFSCPEDSGAACSIRDPSQCSVSSRPRGELAVLGGVLLLLGWSSRRRRP
jgi:hypothetical protein